MANQDDFEALTRHALFDIDCAEAVASLLAHFDGDLDDDCGARIKQHLEACEPCGAAARFEREFPIVIADRCQDRVPDALRSRIIDALAEERQRDS